jgi:hypothetical protein
MSNQQNSAVAYSLGKGPLSKIFPPPIVAKRAPTVNDIGYQLGQEWVWPGNGIWFLEQVVAGAATWLNVAGGAGIFTSLTVNPGPTNLSTVGNGAVTIGNATNTGAITLSVGTGNLAINGNGNTIGIGADAAANTINIGNNTGATTVNINGGTAGAGAILIGTTANNVPVSIGSSTGLSLITINGGTAGVTVGTNAVDHPVSVGSVTGASATTIRGGTSGVTLTAPFVALPGPVYIYTGAGAPGNGLALHVGDLYINTTAASAVTRMYIATGVGAWTNITCAG